MFAAVRSPVSHRHVRRADKSGRLIVRIGLGGPMAWLRD